MEAPEGTGFASSDGSCLTNPGPCGAGAVVYSDQHNPVQLKRTATRGSILLAEHVAILLVIEHVIQNLASIPCTLLKIFSDSQSALGILSLNWKDTRHRDVTMRIRKGMSNLQSKGSCVHVDWIPGHSSIAGNEVADRLAKGAAQEASNFPEDRMIVSRADIKQVAQRATIAHPRAIK